MGMRGCRVAGARCLTSSAEETDLEIRVCRHLLYIMPLSAGLSVRLVPHKWALSGRESLSECIISPIDTARFEKSPYV